MIANLAIITGLAIVSAAVPIAISLKNRAADFFPIFIATFVVLVLIATQLGWLKTLW